jgi:hypothetical protein
MFKDAFKLEQDPKAVPCKHGDESSSMKGGEFFDSLTEHLLLEKNSVHRVTCIKELDVHNIQCIPVIM